MYICIYICIYVYMYICMFIYICIYASASASASASACPRVPQHAQVPQCILNVMYISVCISMLVLVYYY